MIDRREFIRRVSSLVGGMLVVTPSLVTSGTRSDRLGTLLPTRAFGQTGIDVTMLGLGGWHIGRMDEKEAKKTIETALEGGIRFFDSAEGYQKGESERRLGKLLVPDYRDEVFLMTKTTASTKKDALDHLHASLRRLDTDYLDLWQVHAIGSPSDVDDRINGGVLEAMQEARESGKVRVIGFTGHRSPSAHERMLEQTDMFQACQMPVNVVDPSYNSFIVNVLPGLLEQNMGVIAMKTLANGGFFGGTSHGEHGDEPKLVPDRLSIDDAIRFVWSLPVSVLVTGPDDAAQLQEKIEMAKAFTPLNEEERTRLIERVADRAGSTVEYYKA
jgi:aryl-alcohol dehydrogenase-like predicted oxidoreductase